MNNFRAVFRIQPVDFTIFYGILQFSTGRAAPGVTPNRELFLRETIQTMKFVLKQYDKALLSFDLRSEGLDGFACTLLEKEERHRKLFPLGLQLTDKGLLG